MKCKRNRVYRQQVFLVLFYRRPILGVFSGNTFGHSWLHSYSPIMSWQLLRLANACVRVHAGRRPTLNFPRLNAWPVLTNQGASRSSETIIPPSGILCLGIVSRLVHSYDSKIGTSVLVSTWTFFLFFVFASALVWRLFPFFGFLFCKISNLHNFS